MAEEEAKRIFAEQAGASMQKAAKEALSNIFFVGFEEANTRFTSALYYLIKTVLAKMASNSFLDDTFDRNLERWTQTSSFMDAFTQCGLKFPRFV